MAAAAGPAEVEPEELIAPNWSVGVAVAVECKELAPAVALAAAGVAEFVQTQEGANSQTVSG